MKPTTSKNSNRTHLLAVLGMASALLTLSAGAVRAESGAAADASLIGVWSVQVTLRDCTTNAPLGSFNSLVTAHRGGTMTESAASLAFAPGQRSPGQGNWSRRGDTFRQRMIALILSDTPPNLPGTPSFNPSLPISPGFFAGWQTVTHTIELVDANHLVSAGTNNFFKSTGELYRSGCSTAVGQRFK